MTNNTRSGALAPQAIDKRDLASFARWMKETAPFYTPEWRFSPDDPDPGTALFFLAANMLQENVKRLNRAPEKNFISFLNMLETRLQSARPARTNVVFRLNEGASEPVWIPKGTQLTAPSPNGGEELIYESDRALLVTPARLTDIISVSPAQDAIALAADNYSERLAADKGDIGLFQAVQGTNLQEHALYLREDDLLHATHPAVIKVNFYHSAKKYKQPQLAEIMADTTCLEWSYYSEGEWVSFDHVTPAVSGIVLHKSVVKPVDKLIIGGIEGRFIRCRLKSLEGAANPLLSQDVELDEITLTSAFDPNAGVDGIAPSMLIYNDMELSPDGFYPFGEHFAPYSTFYISSEEALCKREGRLSIRFRMKAVASALRTAPDPEIRWRMIMRRAELEKKDPPRIRIQRVLWEYWNGSGWVKFPGSESYETMFGELPEDEDLLCSVSLQCPEDLERTFVNAQFDYWIRVRVIAMDNMYAPEMVYVTPWLNELKLQYSYGDRSFPAESAVAFNNAAMRDLTLEAGGGSGTPFRIFEPIDCEHPAVVLGFDVPPVKGPISLFVTLAPSKWEAVKRPWVEWEALVREGTTVRWMPLSVIDETNGFTESGSIQFAGPPELSSTLLYGRERYWLRAVNRDDSYDASDFARPAANRLDLNAVSVLQQRTITAETPERSRGIYRLSRSPVIAEEVWVDETEAMTLHELEAHVRQSPESIEVLYDSEGLVQRVWVRWSGVDSFLASAADDRHYVLDGSAGTITFGEGIHGRAVPGGGPDSIRVNYKVTAGEEGNIGAGEIKGLLQSIAFIAGATNPEPAGGGCHTERLEAAMLRGPQRLKHQGRAVTAEDFEWLAREAYPGLTKVKCLPNRNVYMEHSLGSITLVALSVPGERGYALFPALKRQIEAYLIERAANTVAHAPSVQVIAPAFLEVSVTVVVTVEALDDVLPTETACIDKLTLFLDPLKGKLDGRGWEIGETLHPSLFYSLLKSIRSIKNIDKLYLSMVKVEDGTRTEIDPAKQSQFPHALLCSGSHKVHVQTN
ncbi:baseplate J/gp47 family protein [Paenibacillus sp. R14(2021)]|uniref:baseplate J/gp47 family protein n=1 Tax=Paenibacillus sp. R14(2021) TaxID=2859228 RepID=UPI001C61246E|nr:baseplate J/gp47 family protein [Paenibacillus sp. R14(2021)]